MIPVEFEYTAPESLEEAHRALQEDPDAKLLAGGHSLVPMLKERLAAPSQLVDLRRIGGLHGIERQNGTIRIGAMVRHAAVASHVELGAVARAARTIADPQVRHRGTIGGSIAHGDPASDLPAVIVALDGVLVVSQPGGGTREIAASEFFLDYLTTSLAPDEILTEIRIPAIEGAGSGYQKFNARHEDWAMVAVSATVARNADGSCGDVRIGMANMGSTPLRARASEDALRGGALDAAAIAAAAELAAEGTDPPGDMNASPDYKRQLARVLTRRALQEAAG